MNLSKSFYLLMMSQQVQFLSAALTAPGGSSCVHNEGENIQRDNRGQ